MGIDIGLHWFAPSQFVNEKWLFHESHGCGECACHFHIIFLGLSLLITVYKSVPGGAEIEELNG